MSAAAIAITAALLGLTGVVLGAFGAHGLSARGIAPAGLASWGTATDYQLLHALALLALSVWMRQAAAPVTVLGLAGVAIAIGVVLFAGSIYVLVLGGPRWLGPVTPLGGLFLITGWVLVLLAALRH